MEKKHFYYTVVGSGVVTYHIIMLIPPTKIARGKTKVKFNVHHLTHSLTRSFTYLLAALRYAILASTENYVRQCHPLRVRLYSSGVDCKFPT